MHEILERTRQSDSSLVTDLNAAQVEVAAQVQVFQLFEVAQGIGEVADLLVRPTQATEGQLGLILPMQAQEDQLGAAASDVVEEALVQVRHDCLVRFRQTSSRCAGGGGRRLA